MVTQILHEAQSGGGRLEVHPDSPHCKQEGNMLNCDFNNSPETAFLEEVYKVVSNPKFPGMKDVDRSGRSAKGITVLNIRSLIIPWAACVNLEIINVKSVQFGGKSSEDEACSSSSTSIKLVESHANLIPRYISRLEMTKSSVVNLILDNEITQLEAVDSKFEIIDIVQNITYSQIVKFERCSIDKIKKLSVAERATLEMIDTKVKKSPPQSVYIENTAASIHNCKFNNYQAVTVGANAVVSFKGSSSYLELSGPTDDLVEDKSSERRAPGVPIPGAVITCRQQSSLIWIIPIVAILVETIIILFNFKNWFPGRSTQSGNPTSPVTRGFESPSMFPGVVGGVPRGTATDDLYHEDSSQSSNNWYYSSESSTANTNLKYRRNF